MPLILQDPGMCGVTGFFYHILQNCTPKCKLPTQKEGQSHPEGEAARAPAQMRMSKCSITSMLPPPGRKHLDEFGGTFTVPPTSGWQLNLPPHLQTSFWPARRENNKGGGGRARCGCSVWMCFLQHHSRLSADSTEQTAFAFSTAGIIRFLKLHRN